MSVKYVTSPLTPYLKSAREKYGTLWDDYKNLHLRELHNVRQVVRYHSPHWSGRRDSSGVEVVVQAHSWAALGVRRD